MTDVSEEIKFDQILEELEILLDSDFLFLLNSVYAEINEEEKKYFTFKKISYSYAEYIIKRGVFSEVPFEYGDICTSPYPFGIVAKGSCEIQRKRSFGDKQYTLPDKILFPKDFIGLFENVDYLTGSSNTTPKWDITSGVITLNLINRKLGVGTCKTLQKRWNEEYSELAPFPNIDCDKVKTNDREFIKFVINQNVINVSDWDTEVIYFNPKILELVQKKCDNISLMKIKNYLLTKAWKSAAPIRSSGSNTFLDIKEKK